MAAIDTLVFFGTPDFAVPTLDALEAAGRTPRLVVSQPSRRAGRGRRVEDPPVAAWAKERSIRLEQPEKVRVADFLDAMRELAPDVAVVVAFGQIFPEALLSIPRLGCVNVHASLLPRFRGAAPVQAAIAEGDAETGVTTMQMDAGMDTGPMLLRGSLPIGPRETAPELAGRLAALGGDLLVRTLDGLEAGELIAEPQSAQGVTYAPRIKKTDGYVSWSDSSSVIERRFRAYRAWPGLACSCLGRPLSLLDVEEVDERVARPPGTFLGVVEGGLRVACGDGTMLSLRKVQRPGRRGLAAVDFVNGERLVVGSEDFGELDSEERAEAEVGESIAR